MPHDTTLQRVEPQATVSDKENSSGADKDDLRSAWNNAGTWEEVEKTEWCKGKLTEALRYLFHERSECLLGFCAGTYGK